MDTVSSAMDSTLAIVSPMLMAYLRLRVPICSETSIEGSTLHFVSVSVCGIGRCVASDCSPSMKG